MNEANTNSRSNFNTWKIVGALVFLAALLAVFVVGPYLSGSPEPGPEVVTPSMRNVPPSGALTLEIDPSIAPPATEEPK